MEVTAPVSTPESQPAHDVASEQDVSRETSSKAEPAPKKPQPSLQELPPEIAQLKKESQMRFDEAAKLRREAAEDRKQAEESRKFIELAKTNPRELERLFGKEQAVKIAEELLFSVWEEGQLTPEQRAERDARKAEKEELERYRSEKKQREDEEAQKAKEAEELQRQKDLQIVGDELDSEITQAMIEFNLDKTPENILYIADHLIAQDAVRKARNPKEAAEKVRALNDKAAKNFLNRLTPEQITQEFPELVKKLREFDIARTSSALPSFQTGASRPQSEEPRKSGKQKRTIDEFFKALG